MASSRTRLLFELIDGSTDDEAIARVLGCTVAQVKRARKTRKDTLPSLNSPIRQKRVYKDRFTNGRTAPPEHDSHRRRSSDNARNGSMALLTRMLETGHHWLTDDQFHAVVNQIQQDTNQSLFAEEEDDDDDEQDDRLDGPRRHTSAAQV